MCVCECHILPGNFTGQQQNKTFNATEIKQTLFSKEPSDSHKYICVCRLVISFTKLLGERKYRYIILTTILLFILPSRVGFLHFEPLQFFSRLLFFSSKLSCLQLFTVMTRNICQRTDGLFWRYFCQDSNHKAKYMYTNSQLSD